VTQAIADEYRRKAEECRLQAGKALRDDDKAAWFKMAEDWQRLAEDIDRNRREASGAAEPRKHGKP
jgi:gluconate kinase